VLDALCHLYDREMRGPDSDAAKLRGTLIRLAWELSDASGDSEHEITVGIVRRYLPQFRSWAPRQWTKAWEAAGLGGPAAPGI
jgi:hypothetical protein